MSKKENNDAEKPVDGDLVVQPEKGERQVGKSEAVKALTGPKTFRFRDTDYVLAELTEEQKEYLRQFPEQVPYLGE